MTVQPHVRMIRETLEAALAPKLASFLLFRALERWGQGLPGNPSEVSELVNGPLSHVLEEQLGSAERSKLIDAIGTQLSMGLDDLGIEVDLDVDVDFDDLQPFGEDEDEEEESTAIITLSPAVSVVILTSSKGFPDRILASLGERRVKLHQVRDANELRHALFSRSPLITVVDATTAPEGTEEEVATVLTSLPDRTMGVVWGEDTRFGTRVRQSIEQTVPVLWLDRSEGVAPLLDLILSRCKQRTKPPSAPPR